MGNGEKKKGERRFAKKKHKKNTQKNLFSSLGWTQACGAVVGWAVCLLLLPPAAASALPSSALEHNTSSQLSFTPEVGFGFPSVVGFGDFPLGEFSGDSGPFLGPLGAPVVVPWAAVRPPTFEHLDVSDARGAVVAAAQTLQRKLGTWCEVFQQRAKLVNGKFGRSSHLFELHWLWCWLKGWFFVGVRGWHWMFERLHLKKGFGFFRWFLNVFAFWGRNPKKRTKKKRPKPPGCLKKKKKGLDGFESVFWSQWTWSKQWLCIYKLPARMVGKQRKTWRRNKRKISFYKNTCSGMIPILDGCCAGIESKLSHPGKTEAGIGRDVSKDNWKVSEWTTATKGPREKKPHWTFFHGGAAGASVTNRKKQEKVLLEGLQQLLQSLPQNQQSSDSESDGWEVKGKGKGKRGRRSRNGFNAGSENTHGQGDLSPSSPRSPRRVSFQEDSTGPSVNLLAELKALILAAETNGTKDLLVNLRSLVNRCVNPGPNKPSGTGNPDPRTWQRPSPKIKPKPTPGPQFASVSAPKIDKNWWQTISASRVEESLELGEEPPGDIALCTLEQAKKLKVLAEAHRLEKPFALLCWDAQDKAKAEEHKCQFRWCKLVGGRWKELPVLSLNASLPTWKEVPEVQTATAPETMSLATFRVTISKQFLTQKDWNDAVVKPVKFLTASLPEKLSVRTYGWHHDPKAEVVMGFLKTPLDKADLILTNSGFQQVFFARIDKDVPREPVMWIPSGDFSPTQYLAEVRRKAKENKAGIALRKGKKTNLGLIGLRNEAVAENGAVRKRWVARGVPNSWTPEQMEQFLTTNKWRLLEDFQSPARKNGIWSFKGVAPAGNSTLGFVHRLENFTIIFSPWQTKKVQKRETVPIFQSKSWVSTIAPASEQPEVNDVAPTAKDTQTDGEDSYMTSVENDQKREAINSPEKAKAAKVARKEAAVKTSEENIPECPKDVGPGKVRCWDLQGSGDCGFRAICAANALKHKGKPEEIQAKISKLAVSLRAKACIWLRQEQSWRETWFPDPEMTTTTEGGTIPSDLLSYLNVISRESKWMDPWLCHAVCNVILQDVIVFKYSKKMGLPWQV